MKRILACSIAGLALCGSIGAQTIQVNSNNRTLEVTATSSATARADVAKISIGFQVSAPSSAEAYRQGSQISNAVVAAVKQAGVAAKDIESQNQNLARTVFPYDDKTTPEERAQRQFTLSQSWTVTTPANKAAVVLRAAIEAGANDSGNIDWELKTQDALQAQAAEKALVHARSIAMQMASGLGVKLGPLVYASNQAPEPTPARFFGFTETRIARQQSAPPLALGPQEVKETATVHAVFAIQ